MIFEGLHVNDLDGVLIPVISIDEYHGKIDDESIVISFFLSDPNAALDLSSFIESGPFEILDSDVSKAINEDGYYQVFIEMERSSELYHNLTEILNAIESLASGVKWSFMTPRTKGESILLTPENLKQSLFSKTPEKKNQTLQNDAESMAESVLDFLANSNAQNVKLFDNSIILGNNNLVVENKFVTFSDANLISHILGLSLTNQEKNSIVKENVTKLSLILGSEWLVESAGQFILVSSDYSPNKVLLLK